MQPVGGYSEGMENSTHPTTLTAGHMSNGSVYRLTATGQEFQLRRIEWPGVGLVTTIALVTNMGRIECHPGDPVELVAGPADLDDLRDLIERTTAPTRLAAEREQMTEADLGLARARLGRLRDEVAYHDTHGTRDDEWARDETLAEIGYLAELLGAEEA